MRDLSMSMFLTVADFEYAKKLNTATVYQRWSAICYELAEFALEEGDVEEWVDEKQRSATYATAARNLMRIST